MTDVDVFIAVNDAGTLSKLKSAWIYWKERNTLSVLRADDQGLIFKLKAGADPNQPASYTATFTTRVDEQVEVYFSEGAKPLPQSLIEPLLRPRQVPLSLSSDLASFGPVHVTPGQPATLRRLPLARIDLEPPGISLTSPADEPALLLASFELMQDPIDPYYVDSIPQGQAFFAVTNTVRESGVAPAAAVGVRPRARGIEVTGTVPSDATGAKLKLLNAQGTFMSMLSDGSNLTSAPITELQLTLGQASGKQRSFTGIVFLPADTQFGPVQLVIEPEGLTPGHLAGFSFLLLGAQVGITDDFPAGATGANAGPVASAADEVVVLDYTSSPAVAAGTLEPSKNAARASQQAAGRARRLLRFPLQSVKRPTGAGPGVVQKLVSQMPFLMMELQLLGAERGAIEELLRLREQRTSAPSNELRLSTEWSLSIDWPTPDRGAANPFLQPSFSITDKQDVVLKLDANADVTLRKLDGVSAGEASSAFATPPPTLSFPEPGRRQPKVRVSEAGAVVERAWGRHGGTANQPSTVIEWQPVLTTTGSAADKPLIRGGNVEVTLRSLTLAGAVVAPGPAFPRPTPAGALPTKPATGVPLAFVPHFRIHGLNPAPADLTALVDAVTESEFNANRAARPYLDFIPLEFWKVAMRGIVTHETNGRQFATRGGLATGVIAFASGGRTQAHGKERDMPIFGPPHGYGLGQLDPPDNIDQVWDLEQAVLECVRRLLLEKASDAQRSLANEFAASATAPLSTRSKNVFLRESVRRFNGGSEFVRNAANTDWEVFPSIRNDPTIFYCDEVLNGGQTLAYQDLVRAPNKREPLPARRTTVSTTPLAYTSASFVPGL